MIRANPCARMVKEPYREEAPMRALLPPCGFRAVPCVLEKLRKTDWVDLLVSHRASVLIAPQTTMCSRCLPVLACSTVVTGAGIWRWSLDTAAVGLVG